MPAKQRQQNNANEKDRLCSVSLEFFCRCCLMLVDIEHELHWSNMTTALSGLRELNAQLIPTPVSTHPYPHARIHRDVVTVHQQLIISYVDYMLTIC